MAGRDQDFDKGLKPHPQLVPPKWNVFDHVMLLPDEKRYLSAIGGKRRGQGFKVSREIRAVPSTSEVG